MENQNLPNTNDLSWCGGFFDGEGSFSFAPKCPSVGIVNTNPIAVTKFMSTMKKNNVNFKITERSKPSKSSKKKRWDMYLLDGDEIRKFLILMEEYIHGKNFQLQLLKNFYDENYLKLRSYSNIIKDYHELMMYYNQSSHILIKDEKKLFEKIGYTPQVLQHQMISDDNKKINYSDFNNIYYLSGIIDAEGTVYINRVDQKKYDGNRYIPSVSFTNTNKSIIEKCCSTLKNSEIGHYIYFRVPETRNRGRWDISISGVRRCKSVCELLKNKLVIKNRQIDLLYEYCEMRLNNLMDFNQFGDSFKESIESLNSEN